MAGTWGEPYRPPCSGTWPAARRWALGSCFQHRKGIHTAKVSAVEVTDGGTGYTTATISFTPADDGADAHAVAVIEDGVITEINVTNGGHDYEAPPTVVITGDGDGAAATATVVGVPLYPNTEAGITPPDVQTEEDCVGGTLVEGNCYQLDQVNVGDSSLCRMVGRKSALSRRAWHGRYGFTMSNTSATVIPRKYSVVGIAVSHAAGGSSWYVGEGGLTEFVWSCSAERAGTMAVADNSGILTVTQATDTTTPIYNPDSEPINGYAGIGTEGTYEPRIDILTMMRHMEDDGIRYPAAGNTFWPEGSIATCLAWFITSYLCAEGEVTLEVVNDYTLELHLDREREHSPGEEGGYSWSETLDVVITLSGETTKEAMLEDLLKEWNLADDVQYPWRTDASLTLVPLVCRDEVPFAVSPDAGWDFVMPDPNALLYTGALLGAPLPNGCGPHYSFELEEWNPGGGLPDTATYWAESLYPTNHPPGGWIHWTYTTGVLYVQMWAEIMDVPNSVNFFRACGADRLKVDENDASNLAWNGKTYCENQTAETPLYLFPDAWPICGRIVVVSATQNGDDVDIVLAEPAEYLMPDDLVDFVSYDEAFAETVDDGDQHDPPDSAGYSVVGLQEGKFEFTIADATVPEGGWDFVKSHNAPHFKWHDDRPKGDYLFNQWETDYSTSPATETFSCTQGCLRRIACHPSVVAVAPFAIAFGNGVVHSLDAADVKPMLGANWEWQGIGELDTEDPFWQGLHDDCDTTEPYPTTPARVEARCAAPDGAPTLPTVPGGYPYGCPDATACPPPA